MNLDSEKRLTAVEDQLAELTRRIYHIEQLLSQITSARTPVERVPAEDSPVTPQATSPPWPVAHASSKTANAEEQTAARADIPAAFPGPTRPFEPQAPEAPRFGVTAASKPSRSLESVVGGQWLNRLGILAVLVGISYFLKLAFENDWIGPAARVLTGLLCGIGLLAWSERFRSRGFATFAYSLKAIGLGTLYLSLWASSQFYHVVSPVVAFAGMVAVTLTSAILALLQDSELLAAGALVGGFLTPILVSSNQNQEGALLSYLLLLDLGAFWMVWEKRWPWLLPGAFGGTALLSAGWASAFYNESELATTLAFATLFFLLFAIGPFLERLATSSETRQRTMQASLIVANALAYLGILFLMLWGTHRDLLAWLLFAVAAFYFGLRRLLQHPQRSNANLDTLLFGLIVSFVTISIPVALDGRWIIFSWDAEAAVILWLAHQAKDRSLRLPACMVLGLAVLRLIIDSNVETIPIFNPRFGLYLLTIAVTALLGWVSLQLDAEESPIWAVGAVILINLLALGALGLELRDYFSQAIRTTAAAELQAIHIEEAFSYSALGITYAAALMTVGFLKREAFLRWQGIVLLGAAALKVFFFDIATLDRGYRIAAFIALGIVLLAVSFSYQRLRAGREARQ